MRIKCSSPDFSGYDGVKKEFTDDELNSGLDKFQLQAKDILGDEKKFEKFVRKTEKWLSKFRDKPVIGGIIDDLIATLQFLNDYKEGKYRNVPLRIIISTIAAILYIVSPIDFISDWIPVVGLLDDVAVFTFIMGLGLSSELKKYKDWRDDKDYEEILSNYENDIVIDDYEEEWE